MITTLQVGDYTILNAWVHDNVKESNAILFNQSLWPGVVEGDMLRITASNEDSDPGAGILFIVPRDEGSSKPQLQVRVSPLFLNNLRVNTPIDINPQTRGRCF